MSEENEITIDFSDRASFKQRHEDRADRMDDGRTCSHDRVWIKGKHRWLECRSCGQVIDAFDYLMRMANKDLRVVYAHDRLMQEAEHVRREIESLKRQRTRERKTNRNLGLQPEMALYEDRGSGSAVGSVSRPSSIR